jgi:hypothetical protein
VFNARDDSLIQVLHRCVDDLRLWANRCRDPSEAATLNTWCLSFDPPWTSSSLLLRYPLKL